MCPGVALLQNIKDITKRIQLYFELSAVHSAENDR